MRVIGIGGIACIVWAMAALGLNPAAPQVESMESAFGPGLLLAEGDDKSLGDKPEPPLAGPRGRRDDDDRPDSRGRPSRFGRGPGDHPDRPPGHGGPEGGWLSPEQIDRLMGFIKENFPKYHEHLADARKNNPAAFRHMIHRAAPIMMRMVRMKFENPEIAEKMIAEHKVQIEIEDLTRRYRNAPAAERNRIKPQLREQVAGKFDIRLERLRVEIRDFQRRLDEAKQDLADQETNKEQLIDDRVEELIAGSDKEK